MAHANHFDENGAAHMADVSAKRETPRTATAGGCICMNEAAFAALAHGTAQKGDVLGLARAAGILAAKQTAHLIPLCHPLLIERADIAFTLNAQQHSVTAACTVQTHGKTGVEMEALCGAGIALLTIYDMCKALDRGMVIREVCLWEKQGGKSGRYLRGQTP